MGILMVGMVNPEIDRRISKKWKKTKLPGKTSWKFPIWLFICSDSTFREKSNLQHCGSIFFQKHGFFDVQLVFHWKIFTPKSSKTFFPSIVCGTLQETQFFHYFSPKKRIVFQLLTVCMVLFMLAMRFFLPIGALALYPKREQYNL